MIDYVIGIGVILISALIVIRLINKYKKGKESGCGYGCSSCSANSACKPTYSKKD